MVGGCLPGEVKVRKGAEEGRQEGWRKKADLKDAKKIKFNSVANQK